MCRSGSKLTGNHEDNRAHHQETHHDDRRRCPCRDVGVIIIIPRSIERPISQRARCRPFAVLLSLARLKEILYLAIHCLE